ncbi:hypothetical protein NST14_01970 [Bacillus sp. FSL W8-0519]|nr:hypothetical protein [Bacillus paranthracis]MBL3756651.1 hypothetical protein [Bacillus cereus]MCC2412265.1 hypothetical protein [Bacillus paranthracis]
MKKQTKLVNCGSKVFVYDFKRKEKIENLNFEQDGINGNITHLERLLLTNFIDDSLLTNFCLSIPLNEYEYVQNRLNSFIKSLKKATGHKQIKYLAIAEPSPHHNEDTVDIHLITSIEIDDLMIHSNEDMTEEEQEEYFANIWGDELYIDVCFPNELIKTFTVAYKKSLMSNALRAYPKSFHSNLQQPSVLWNEDAKAFIKHHKLLERALHHSTEIYDDIGGFVTINEYSMSNYVSLSEEMDMAFF